jgi:hypothetical protein
MALTLLKADLIGLSPPEFLQLNPLFTLLGLGFGD